MYAECECALAVSYGKTSTTNMQYNKIHIVNMIHSSVVHLTCAHMQINMIFYKYIFISRFLHTMNITFEQILRNPDETSDMSKR